MVNPSPLIHHTRTGDGIRIAYWSLGTGEPPLLILPTPQSSHIGIEWEEEGLKAFYQRLASRRHIIRFDSRGTGLSERNIEDLSLTRLHEDITAVLDDLGLERVSLLAQTTACPVALSYAAEHPLVVSHCILWNPMWWGRHAPLMDALASLIDDNWPLYLRARYKIQMGDEDAAFRSRLTQAAVTPEFFKKVRDFWLTIDGESYLDRVQARTLVMHRREELLGRSTAELEKLVPNAAGITLEGTSPEMHIGDPAAVISVINTFLDDANQRVFRPLSELELGLSERELEILSLLTEGYRGKEIARHLSITLNTVERHIANIYRKTGVHGRGAVVAFAIKHGIVQQH